MTPSAKPIRRVVIVGAGPGGLTAAAALATRGVEVAVYERATSPDGAGSGLTLWPNAMRAFQAIGAAEAVSMAGAPCEGIALRSADGTLLDATPRAVMEQRFGGPGVAFHRAELIGALLELVGSGVVRRGAECVAVRQDDDGATAVFADGTETTADLVVGADGIRSAVRSSILPGERLRYAGFPVWRSVTELALDPAHRVGVVTMGRGAQFGAFPITRGRVYWFASANAPAGSARSGGPHKERLLARFGDWHSPVGELVDRTDERAIVVSDVYFRSPSKRWSRGRATLVGDAAHPIPPNLGQGACQAIEDAVVLADCVARSRDHVSALDAYERRRVARANGIAAQSIRLARLGRWRSPLACRLRDELIRRVPERARARQLDRLFRFEP